jgi:hypothetical protein
MSPRICDTLEFMYVFEQFSDTVSINNRTQSPATDIGVRDGLRGRAAAIRKR